jgi:hypothetical protein
LHLVEAVWSGKNERPTNIVYFTLLSLPLSEPNEIAAQRALSPGKRKARPAGRTKPAVKNHEKIFYPW